MEILQTHKWKGVQTSSSPALFCAFHVEKPCSHRPGIKAPTDLHQLQVLHLLEVLHQPKVLHQPESFLLIPVFLKH